MLCRSSTYETVPYPLIFTPIAALLQSVLQANSEAFRNGLVETMNRAVEMRNGLRTSQNVSKRCAGRPDVHF